MTRCAAETRAPSRKAHQQSEMLFVRSRGSWFRRCIGHAAQSAWHISTAQWKYFLFKNCCSDQLGHISYLTLILVIDCFHHKRTGLSMIPFAKCDQTEGRSLCTSTNNTYVASPLIYLSLSLIRDITTVRKLCWSCVVKILITAKYSPHNWNQSIYPMVGQYIDNLV